MEKRTDQRIAGFFRTELQFATSLRLQESPPGRSFSWLATRYSYIPWTPTAWLCSAKRYRWQLRFARTSTWKDYIRSPYRPAARSFTMPANLHHDWIG